MKKIVSRALVMSAAMALAVPVVAAGSAQAGAYRPLSERTLENSSMSAADIPRWMRHGGAPEVERFFSHGRDAGGPLLCPGGKNPSDFISGKRAKELMNSRAILWEAPPNQRGQLNSFIYQYRSRGDAESAWADLTAQASTCPSFIRDYASSSGPDQVTVSTRVSALPGLFGTAGLEVWTNVSFGWDTYANFYLAGTSIVKVQHEVVRSGSSGMGRVSRGFVQSMAIVVAQRVERHSSR